MRAGLVIVVIVIVLLLISGSSVFYVLDETEQAIITQFGEPVAGGAITDPGLHVKVPVIQKVNRFDKRWIAWDGDVNQVPTKDKKYIWVDTYARWRIADPLKFFQAVRNERGAQTRLDDIIDGETRNVIASYDLIEAVRSTNRPFEITEELKDITPSGDVVQIRAGRDQLEQEILTRAAAIAPDLGIELVDVRFKRLDYIESVRQKVYERMISERQRIAEQYRSEGQGRSAEIRGQMERELKKIRSEAYRTSQEIIGRADAKATGIYAKAYTRDRELYAFLRTLETWEKTLSDDTRLVLTTDSDLLKYLKKSR
ncbi:MAG: protease modulator HflC [Acidobacteriota bacterium]|nr:MAG: protease modulator HflC [Acidobacteriota bacterium]